VCAVEAARAWVLSDQRLRIPAGQSIGAQHQTTLDETKAYDCAHVQPQGD
jgi:hypothetical protein